MYAPAALLGLGAAVAAMPPAASAADADSAARAGATPRLELVLAGRWENQVLSQLRRAGLPVRFRNARTEAQALRLLRRLRRARAASTSSPSSYALVVDASHRSKRSLRRSRAIEEAIEDGNWVIALDAGRGKRSAAFGARTGLQMAGVAAVTAVRRGHTTNGKPEIRAIDVRAPRARRASRRAPGATRVHARQLYRELVRNRRPSRIAGGATGANASTGADAAGEMPRATPRQLDSLLSARWSITSIGSPILGWANLDTDRPKNWQQLKQQPLISATHTFTAYYANPPTISPGDPQATQYVYYQLDGSVNPATGRGNADQRFISNPLAGGRRDERGWWTAGVQASMAPPNGMVLVGSDPKTPNTINEYTSGTKFSFGFKASAGLKMGDKTEGNIGGEATVGFEHTETVKRNIPDWGVASRDAGNAPGWEFFSKTPCDFSGGVQTIVQNEGPRKCFYSGHPLWHREETLPVNELSAKTMDFHATAVWRTTGGPLGVVSFTPRLNTTMGWNWWRGGNNDNYHDSPWYARRDGFFRARMTQIIDIDSTWVPDEPRRHEQFKLNLGAVVPVPVESITFHDDPDGPALDVSKTLWLGQDFNRTIHVCVNLAKPAPASLRLPVGSTNLENFFADGTVAIRERKTRGCFSLRLNANRLREGERSSAQVGVFYGSPHTEQLTIGSGAAPAGE